MNNNNNFNLIVSLASVNRPNYEYKDKRILDRLISKAEGHAEDKYYRFERLLINDVVGSCIYYQDDIDYDNFYKINSDLKKGRKLLVVDLREDGKYAESVLLMDNDFVTFLKGSFYR